jgi:glycosyltransferase involved in cell wall biosynthesis
MNQSVSKTVLLTAIRAFAITNSRMMLIHSFLDAGWRVVLATKIDAQSEALARIGVVVEEVDFERGGFRVFSDLAVLTRLISINRKWKPDLIHNFHLRPIVLSSLASYGDAVICNTVTGLGNALTGSKISRVLVGLGNLFVKSKVNMTIFQNPDDRKLFKERGWVDYDKTALVVGSGVDTDKFFYVDRAARTGAVVKLLYVGRLIVQKGVVEFIQLANELSDSVSDLEFIVVGEAEEHPDAVDPAWLSKQCSITLLGFQDQEKLKSLLMEADIFVFPSYYREGVPRVVLEAAATGLPVVGFDAPGVKEGIVNGETGYLVGIRDLEALTAKTKILVNDTDLRLRLGRNGRRFIEEKFRIESIHEQYEKVYRRLGVTLN